MKNLYLVLILVSSAFLMAAEEGYVFPADKTLLEISADINIPVKKIAQYLDFTNLDDYHISLRELNLTNDEVNRAIDNYYQNRKSMYGGIVLVGMSIVFVSLMLVGLIISMLRHVGEKKQPLLPQKSECNENSASSDTNETEFVAAITAVMIYRKEQEETDRIKLTWTRPLFSGWQKENMIENKMRIK